MHEGHHKRLVLLFFELHIRTVYPNACFIYIYIYMSKFLVVIMSHYSKKWLCIGYDFIRPIWFVEAYNLLKGLLHSLYTTN